MNKSVVQNIFSLIFNIAETAVIVLLGMLLSMPVRYMLVVLAVFLMTRICLGKRLHFKTWYRCLIWSTLTMLSLFVLLKVDLVVSIMFAIFAGFIMTGKSDITDIYFWKSPDSPSKYQDIIEYIKYNEFSDKLLEFENKIKVKGNVEYLIYKYRFKENKTFDEMSELLDMDNPRIVEHLDKIAFALRLYCGI